MLEWQHLLSQIQGDFVQREGYERCDYCCCCMGIRVTLPG